MTVTAPHADNEISFDFTPDDFGVEGNITKEYARRYKADGFEKAVEWLDAESRKSRQQLLDDWADEAN